MRTFLVATLTSLVALIGGAMGLRSYATKHFLPRTRMEAAVAAGDGCILLLGDSRMDAGFDSEAFHRGLRAVGPDRCHAQLAIGATEAGGHFITAREYLARGRRPVVAVLGIAGDSLLGPEREPRPEELVGNDVIHFEWSRPDDVFESYPGFPFADVDAFDTGFRFLAGRATPFGRYQSLIAVKVQGLTSRLTGRAGADRNRFGALGDMSNLEDRLRVRAVGRLGNLMRIDEPARLGHWFQKTAALVEATGARFMIVELPMPSRYRNTVTDRPEAAAYRAWLAQELASAGRGWLDLSHVPGLRDELFGDALHLAPAGAALVSEEIGRRVSAMLIGGERPQPQPQPIVGR